MCVIRLSLCPVVLSFALGHAQLWAEEVRHAIPAAAAANTSSLTGRVLYDGEPPEPGILQIPLRRRVRNQGLEFDTEELPGRRRLMERGIPDESLIVGEERGIANVLVWVISKDVPIPEAPRKPLPPVALRAVNGRLTPHVLAFWTVTSLELVNDSGEGTNFHLPGMKMNRLIVDGQKIEVDTEQPLRIPSPVRSNIHPWFNAYVLALNHPYFAVTGDDGRFKITDLPMGEWKFVIWHETTGYLPTGKFPKGRFTLAIKPGNNDIGDLDVDPMPRAVVRALPRVVLGDIASAPDGKANALSELHRAVMAGDVQRVKDLLRIGLNVNDRESRLNGTPLHYAARHGHAEIVRMLAEKGASVNARDINNCTPLMWAAKGGHSDVIRALLDAKAMVDATDNRKWTPLHFAIDRGHSEAAQLLIDNGADVNAKNRDGRKPLEMKLDIQARASP